MTESVQFDRQKFEDLVHYICAKTPSDCLGATKLHKVLYYSDMLYYTEHGSPLTGAVYVKQVRGPIARKLLPTLTRLQRQGRVRISDRNFHGFIKTDYEAMSPATTDRLSARELAHVDAIIERVCLNLTASEVSEISHTAVWHAAEMGEELPYYTAFELLAAEETEDDLAWAEGEVSRIEGSAERAR